ncbi:MAG: DEAD/DEAH box helicase [Alphaproteobacteria bacterium]
MLPPLSRMQEHAIDFALDREGSTWFAPPGMGKTRAWFEVINNTPGRTLVIAPKLVCMNTWPRERVKWGFDNRLNMRFLHGKQKSLRRLPDVCLINYEAIPWLVEETRALKTFPFDSVIFDEVSKLKNPESKRFQAWEDIAHRFKYRSGGTGTPVGAYLKDVFGELYVSDLGESFGTDYERFIREHFYYDEYTKKLDPYHDAEEIIFKKMRDHAISFDINELDMPPLAQIPVWLTLPDDVRYFYERMHADSLVEDLDLSAVNAAVRAGKLRQMASGGVIDDMKERKYLHDAKAEHLKSIVDEFQGEPIMVFFEFLSDYVSICRTLGYEVPALYGKTRTKDVNQIINDWNAGRLPVLALHPRSASYGLNLQESGRVIVWYTVPWSFELVNQGIARMWRQGQQNKVLCYYLLIEDTVDAEVFERVQAREGLHNRLMDALL